MMEWSKGGAENVDRCPACGATDFKPAYTRRDDLLSMPDTWEMPRCSSCASVFLAVRPDATSIHRAYEDYPTHHDGDADQGIPSGGIVGALIRGYLQQRFCLEVPGRTLRAGHLLFSLIEPFRLKLDRFGRHVHLKRGRRADLRLMDVGCGNGGFLSLAGRMGIQASGIDPDPKAAALAQRKGLDVRLGGFDLLAAEHERYDIVTMNQVVEHVFDQRELLSSCFGALKKDGLLWLAYPNPEALGLKVFGSAWCALHPPYHICLTTQAQMCRLLADAGFQDIKVHRRGTHARVHWHDSAAIAQAHGIALPSAGFRHLARWACDGLATLTPRWAEEVVITAVKP